jgi:phosphate:Na+ symporter
MFALLNQTTLFGFVGGLGLFLFGMKILSEGLQKMAGDRMRRILSALTTNRLLGTLVGLLVTTVVQSSSAVAVMVIGFVNAGLMALVPAIGVMLGANIGTTVTAQLLALNIAQLALPAIGIGTALKLFARRRKWNCCGEVLLGFGLLFYGLSTMKAGFAPLKGSVAFHEFFLLIGHNYFLALVTGILLTMLVQSSSATIGIAIALASSGLLAFDVSAALILGENIGTTITVNLAALGTNLAARRTALAHALFNILGVAGILLFFPAFLHLVDVLTPGAPDFVIRTAAEARVFGATVGDKPYIAWHIANSHTLFNIINTLVFLPLLGVLAKITCLLVRGREEKTEFHLKYLDNRVLNTPPIALGQARSETRHMAHLTLEMLDETFLFFRERNEKSLLDLAVMEDAVDLLQKEITDFLVALAQKSITQDMSREIAAMMHIVNDLERVGDHCEALWKLAVRMKELKVPFSPIAEEEIQELAEKTRQFIAFVVKALDRNDATIAHQAAVLVRGVDCLEENLRNSHVTRLSTGECSVQQGLIFIDISHNLAKIASHAFNVAKSIAGGD